MLCEQCGQRQATVHVTRVVNGHATSRHLCERCAREQGDWEPIPFFEPTFGIAELLSGLLTQHGAQLGWREGRNAACPRCRTTYTEFARTGLVGCATCYEAFAPAIEPILRRVHGSTQHGGKAPPRRGRRDAAAELEELRRQLEAAVREERYEDAARLRDRIRRLEGGGGR